MDINALKLHNVFTWFRWWKLARSGIPIEAAVEMHHQVEGNGDTATTFSLGEIASTWSRALANNISWQLLWARVHSQAQCCHRHNEWTFLCPTFFVRSIFAKRVFKIHSTRPWPKTNAKHQFENQHIMTILI